MLLADKYPFITNYFTEVLTKNITPFPQSIIFYGSDIDTQYKLATEIARLLNCVKDKQDDCDCLNCKWIKEGTHPAIVTISRVDNKTEDDETTTAISIKQATWIKSNLMNTSDFHRVFIFCDKDDNGNFAGLNPQNFKDDVANSMLKIIEEPQENITFIFLTRYIDDIIQTIISRSQCFYIPSIKLQGYDYSTISGVMDNYWTFERKDLFDISLKLQNLSKESSVSEVLDSLQNYIFCVLKENPKEVRFIKDIKHIEECKKQAKLGIKASNVFDFLCMELIKN